MKRILPYSDTEIAIRVAKRAALNGRASRAEREAKARATKVAARQAAQAAGFSLDDMLDSEIGPALVKAFGASATPDISRQDADEIELLRGRAREQLPDELKSERWRTTDCACVVERVYYRATPSESTTFAATPCDVHAGLSLDELHDVLEAETAQRGAFYEWLQGELGALLGRVNDDGVVEEDHDALSWAWEGVGKARVARPVLSGKVQARAARAGVDIGTKVAARLAAHAETAPKAR